MLLFIQIVIGLIGLGLMVFIHELGHFLAARAVGIEVEAFAIGWGPTIWRRKRGKTEYRLAAFPIGGYCKMKGEQDMADAIQNKSEYLEASEGSFFGARPWKRIIVSFAGPLVNLIFAIVVISLIWLIGFSYQTTDNRIVLLADYPSVRSFQDPNIPTLTTPDSPAAKAGLKTGDRIISVNDVLTENYRDIQSNIVVAARQELTVQVDRDGARFTTKLTPILDTETGAGRIGIFQWAEPVIDSVKGAAESGGLKKLDRILSINGSPTNLTIDVIKAIDESRGQLDMLVQRNGIEQHLIVVPDYRKDGSPYLEISFVGLTFNTPKMNLVQAAQRGYRETINALVLTFRGITLLFHGLNPTSAVQGPGRITYYIGEAATQGFSVSFTEGIRSFFHILSFISIALFFGNLLPIPALDGGQILLFVWEAISRKPLKMRVVQRYQIIGIFLVFSLLILAVSGDILSIFSK